MGKKTHLEVIIFTGISGLWLVLVVPSGSTVQSFFSSKIKIFLLLFLACLRVGSQVHHSRRHLCQGNVIPHLVNRPSVVVVLVFALPYSGFFIYNEKFDVHCTALLFLLQIALEKQNSLFHRSLFCVAPSRDMSVPANMITLEWSF